jgi:hypothetical protein
MRSQSDRSPPSIDLKSTKSQNPKNMKINCIHQLTKTGTDGEQTSHDGQSVSGKSSDEAAGPDGTNYDLCDQMHPYLCFWCVFI